MDSLNLEIHDIEDIPGKYVTLNGVNYIFKDLYAEGGESFVYPLQNAVSGLVSFLGKVYKFRPGSEEYEAKKNDGSKSGFSLQAYGVNALHIEYYDIPGALIGFQKFLGNLDETDYHEELMLIASDLVGNKKYIEALSAYDDVLKVNPNHTGAMHNKAICFLNLNCFSEALALLSEVIHIEPNETSTYHMIANGFVRHGSPESAVGILEQTLHRYKKDFSTWNLLMEITLSNDLIHTASEWLEEAKDWAPDSEAVRKFQKDLESSQNRYQQYTTAFQTAISIQMKSKWSEALEDWNYAVASSKNNYLALLNRNICKYHLGMGGIAEETLALLNILRGVPQSSCAALAILAHFREGDYEMAKRIAFYLNSISEVPIDLPRIPKVVTNEFALELQDVKELISVINSISSKIFLSKDESLLMQELLDKYKQL